MLQKIKTWEFATGFIARTRGGKPGRDVGVWTRKRLLNLGPTFVKLGQLASTRRDIYSKEFIEELETLQDAVPPMDNSQLVHILQRECSKFESDPFEYFDYTPFKSASLGQVHKARLHSGIDVVVKVQRDGVADTIQTDIDNVTDILKFFELVGVDTGPKSIELLEEARDYLMEELNYIHEAQNATKFFNNFKDTPWVRIPRVYTRMLTPRLMIMEYVPGEKITDINDDVLRVNASRALVRNFVD